MRIAPPRPSSRWVATTMAAAAMSGADAGAGRPAERAKKPGTSGCPTATTGTPRVSRYSSVAGTSRIAFGPAHTTAIAVRPSSSRSDEMSKVGGAAMCAPVRRVADDDRPLPAERAAMDATDPTGGKDPDPRGVGGDHRRRDGRRRPPAVGDGRCQARPGGLADGSGRGDRERLDGRLVQPDEHAPGVDRDGRRDGAGRAHGGLRSAGDGQVLRVRKPVADQGRFEGDDRPALGERGRDLGADVESVGEHRRTA